MGDRLAQEISDKPILVLLIDRDQEARQRLVRRLAQEKDIDIVGSGAEIAEALTTASPGPMPEVAIVCADFPEMMRVRTWAAFRSLLPHSISIVALTGGQNTRILENALAAGVAALHPADVPHGVLCRAIRRTARGEVDFDPILAQRAKALLMEEADEDTIQVGGLSINSKTRRVSRWGKIIELTELEFGVLRQLTLSLGEPVSMERLLHAVWQTSLEAGGTRDQVKSCIKRLRMRLEPEPNKPRYVKWIRNEGYALLDPVPGGLST